MRDSNENKAMLGISSLIHNYCAKDANCQEKQAIKTLIRNFESRLGISCRATSEEEKLNILYALKAIGNAGRLVNSDYILTRCYLEDNPMEIRVAAIDARRRVPCDSRDSENSHLLTLFSDKAQDNEVRIASYLALMRCPTQTLVDTLKDSLTSEGINQVASFVWTHLTNLQESASPDKQWVRHLIGEEFLQKKFTSESLKLSRNFESSFYLKEQKVGADIESNLIFSSKSFLPRSSMLNFTINLFGESINLFEVGGRIEGLESYIEKFFGPEGYYPEETIEALVKNIRKKEPKKENSLEDFLHQEEEDEPMGSYYLKLFGNELYYHNFKGIENALPEITFSNVFDVIRKLAAKESIEYTKSYDLIKSDFTFPTIAGLPIKLSLDGKAVVGLKLDGQFSFESLNSFNIEGTFHPSAAVTIDAAMLVDAFVTKSGVKMVSTMHSSTPISGKAIINKGKLVDLVINTPNEKTEIFDMTNEFFNIENGVDKKKEQSLSNIKRCVSNRVLGMDLCYEFDLSLRLMTSIPSDLRVNLVKTDSHSGYIIKYTNEMDKISLLFSMPGSQKDKNWSASLTRKTGNYELDLHFIINANAKLSYVFNEKENYLDASFILNDLYKYAMKLHYKKEDDSSLKGLTGEILVEYSIPDKDIFYFTGKFTSMPNEGIFNANAKLKGTYVPEFIFICKYLF